MKITVQVDDFYFDDEDQSNLEESLKTFIVQKTKYAIWEAIEKKVEEQAIKIVKDNVEKNLNRKITSQVKQFIEAGEVKSYRGSEYVTIEQYIKEIFEHQGAYNTMKDLLDKKASLFSSQMKSRYDLLFASQLVAKMNGQGLLAEGVYKTIMEKP